MDPLADQNIKDSPYNYAVGNPLMFIDPTGMDTTRQVDPDGIPHYIIDDEDAVVVTAERPRRVHAFPLDVVESVPEDKRPYEFNIEYMQIVDNEKWVVYNPYCQHEVPGLQLDCWLTPEGRRQKVLYELTGGFLPMPLGMIFGTSQATRGILGSWHKATFRSASAAIRYHYGKHVVARGMSITIQQYTDDAVRFYSQNSHRGNPITLLDGSSGIKIRTSGGGPGGIFTSNGQIVSFWYR